MALNNIVILKYLWYESLCRYQLTPGPLSNWITLSLLILGVLLVSVFGCKGEPLALLLPYRFLDGFMFLCSNIVSIHFERWPVWFLGRHHKLARSEATVRSGPASGTRIPWALLGIMSLFD